MLQPTNYIKNGTNQNRNVYRSTKRNLIIRQSLRASNEDRNFTTFIQNRYLCLWRSSGRIKTCPTYYFSTPFKKGYNVMMDDYSLTDGYVEDADLGLEF